MRGTFNSRDRWSTCLGLCLGIGLLIAGPSVFACCENGECAFETCCYANGACMDAGNEYLRCNVEFSPLCNCNFCVAGSSCTNGEECDAN